MYPQGNVLIPSPHGQLEAIYRPPGITSTRVALVMHPHPLFGGTMHNKVVYRAAQALDEVGFATLRFNFRGVGQSTGTHDDGRGEVEDGRVALDYLLDDQRHAELVVVAGFSFGAAVGLQLGCGDARVNELVAIGTPLKFEDLAVLDSCKKPKLFIHGEADEIAPLAPLAARLERLSPSSSWRMVTVEGASHFFEGKLDEMKETLKKAFPPD